MRSQERQERGLVKAICTCVTKNSGQPISIYCTNTRTHIHDIIGAEKYTKRRDDGSEPLTDIVLHKANGKTIHISCKSNTAPSIAGGGLHGLEMIVPSLGMRFQTEAHKHLNEHYRKGDNVPNVFGKISVYDRRRIMKGNRKVGGPIDFIYFGCMDVRYSFDTKQQKLVIFNGRFERVGLYAVLNKLYLRLRKRRDDQRFDPSATSSQRGRTVPVIYGKSPSKKDIGGRIVIVDKPPKNALILNF